jgi:hypothetical protein
MANNQRHVGTACSIFGGKKYSHNNAKCLRTFSELGKVPEKIVIRPNIIAYFATKCCGGEECFTLLLCVHQDEPDEAVNRGSICSRISLQHLYKVFGHHHALTKYLAGT